LLQGWIYICWWWLPWHYNKQEVSKKAHECLPTFSSPVTTAKLIRSGKEKRKILLQQTSS
jgi:hypothetical protein